MNYKNPLAKQLKVLKTIVLIQPLIKRLERLSFKVIRFGSSSRGEDIADSDVDLFVVTHNKEEIEEKVKKFKSKRNIQAIIRTELKYTEMKQTDPVFYDQVSKGIVLWEAETGITKG
jgi:predicted nucleotidyltransferase